MLFAPAEILDILRPESRRIFRRSFHDLKTSGEYLSVGQGKRLVQAVCLGCVWLDVANKVERS